MGLINALAVVIGIMGGIGTYLVLGPLGFLGLAIWAIFIAWACFYHNGGGVSGMMQTIAGNVWGVIIGTLALFLLPMSAGFGLLGAAAVVGVTAFILIMGAHIPFLSSIPAGVYGFAATAGFGLLTKANALDLALGSGPLPTIALSMVIGAILGFISEKIAGVLA